MHALRRHRHVGSLHVVADEVQAEGHPRRDTGLAGLLHRLRRGQRQLGVGALRRRRDEPGAPMGWSTRSFHPNVLMEQFSGASWPERTTEAECKREVMGLRPVNVA